MKAETAMIVGIQHYKNDVAEIEDHLDELEQLVNNIEIDVVNKNIVKLRKITAKYYIGKGKAEELRDTCKRLQIEILVFDEVLSPSQQKNLDKLIGITVIDRQEVILDIFSKRARTKEAKLQIELARAEYNLPRLKRMWTHLSRQKGGGVTQRGTGEKQIEVDRRLVGDRITRLKEELEQVKKHRNVQRKKRQQIPLPNAAIVGYTNAGKSSLINSLTDSHIKVEDKLFATLDPTTRKLTLPDNQILLLTDTVGFIRKLPHQLVESFKATLEEATMADFLVHVVDVSCEHSIENYETTMEVLKELGCEGKKIIQVFNKMDLVEEHWQVNNVKKQFPHAIFVSVKEKTGIEELVDKLSSILDDSLKPIELHIPHNQFEIVALLHRTANVISEEYQDDITIIKAYVKNKIKKKFKEYIQK